MHSNPISRFLAMPMHKYFTPPMLVYDCRSTNTGCVGLAPPPPPRRVSIRVHACEPHFKISGYANAYTSVTPPILVYNCRSTNSRQIRGAWGEPPPPPGFRFVYIYSNPISRFLGMPMHIRQLHQLYWSMIVG